MAIVTGHLIVDDRDRHILKAVVAEYVVAEYVVTRT
jgi:hypothetical protein